jgi:thioredoxin reductase
MTEKFDVIIVGAGPAGISAAITTAKELREQLFIQVGFQKKHRLVKQD